MDSLYARLAAVWDELFPPDHQRIEFVKHLFDVVPVSVPKRIIEVGCGTGATSSGLALAGFDVTASDLDAQMIEIARSRLMGTQGPETNRNGSVQFSVNDMLGALKEPETGSMGAVLCLGNTLPHLAGEEDFTLFFCESRRALAEGGALIIQVLDYSEIKVTGKLVLPKLVSGDLIFRRKQFFDDESERVVFSTEVVSGERSESRNHALYPLNAVALREFAAKEGFTDNTFYKDWNRGPYNSDSPWFVAVFR